MRNVKTTLNPFSGLDWLSAKRIVTSEILNIYIHIQVIKLDLSISYLYYSVLVCSSSEVQMKSNLLCGSLRYKCQLCFLNVGRGVGMIFRASPLWSRRPLGQCPPPSCHLWTDNGSVSKPTGTRTSWPDTDFLLLLFCGETRRVTIQVQ